MTENHSHQYKIISGSDSTRSDNDSMEREEARAREIAHAERMRDIQQDNHLLEILLMKVRSMYTWKSSRARGVNEKMVSEEIPHYRTHKEIGDWGKFNAVFFLFKDKF